MVRSSNKQRRPVWLFGRIALLSLALLGWSAYSTGQAAGQVQTVIGDEVVGGPGDLRLSEVVRIGYGEALDQVGLLTSTRLAQDSEGRFFAAPLAGRTEFASFSPRGQFLGVTGRSGQGPGEFQGITGVFVGPGDSVWVADQFWRVNVFSPDLAFVRTHPLTTGRVTDLLPLAGGNVVAAVHSTVDDRRGPIQFVGPEGEVLHAVGTRSPSALAVDEARFLALGPDGSIWFAHGGRYLLENRSLRADLIQTARRDTGWFVSSDERSEDDRYSDRIDDLQVDSTGLLWVLVRKTDLQWRPPAVEGRERTSHGGGIRLSVEEVGQRNEWILEVLDPVRGALLHRLSLSGHYVGGLLPGRRCYEYTEDDLGNVFIHVHELSIDPGSGL